MRIVLKVVHMFEWRLRACVGRGVLRSKKLCEFGALDE